jgi:hypothetical protein
VRGFGALFEDGRKWRRGGPGTLTDVDREPAAPLWSTLVHVSFAAERRLEFAGRGGGYARVVHAQPIDHTLFEYLDRVCEDLGFHLLTVHDSRGASRSELPQEQVRLLDGLGYAFGTLHSYPAGESPPLDTE